MSKTDEESILIRTPDAAKILGLSVSTLNKYRCWGGGPEFKKYRRSVFYTRRGLKRWANSLRMRKSTSDVDISLNKTKH